MVHNVVYSRLVQGKGKGINLAVLVQREHYVLYKSTVVGLELEAHGQAAAGDFAVALQILEVGLLDNACLSVLDKAVEHFIAGRRAKAVHTCKVTGTDGFFHLLHDAFIGCLRIAAEEVHAVVGLRSLFCLGCHQRQRFLARLGLLAFQTQVAVAHGYRLHSLHHFGQFIIDVGFALKSIFRLELQVLGRGQRGKLDDACTVFG